MDNKRRELLQQFLRRFHLDIDNLEGLNTALTHPTYAYEHQLPHDNQRLEFLGDAVLGLVIATYLYREFPHLPEGDMTRMRAAMVCEASLAKVARQINLGELLLLGQGEEISGGRQRPSNLADALEAVIGSFYLAGGLKTAQDFILQIFTPALEILKDTGVIDSKSALQEFIQQRGPDNVTYKILEEWGPDHAKQYKAGVFYRNRLLATGEGHSKKEAEQEAARAALALIKIQG
ncbi:Ribonuclease III [Moorella glycerini]|uniref:Ribonuclease 3 n=1 Tax=Neomoorella stamsii TaxID=1266720 RepID=A0A9X7P722_9FIRM|nr:MULTISPECIES: ribonuclease III [Moorella]PRR76035.1 Ribonuclease 3 [Moorella stamsii]CEP68359.1 Ribonuclease III [Moorella glycerini]